MGVLKDFECEGGCGVILDVVVSGDTRSMPCPKCGANSNTIITKAPGFIGSSSYEKRFTPHYDLQLGQYFQSADHKTKFLNKNEIEQSKGEFSPQTESKTRFKCTEKTSQRHFRKNAEFNPTGRRKAKPKEDK